VVVDFWRGGGMNYNNNYKKANRPLKRTTGKRSYSYGYLVYLLKNKAELIFIWCLVAFNVILIMSLAQRFIRPPGRPDQILIHDAVKLEVLNGCGEQGLATVVANCLEQQRYRILNIGNAPEFNFSRTIMFNRGKREDKAIQNLQETLGLDEDQVLLVRQDENQADVTLIVGCDYRKLKCYRPE
jgi:hypothetical protein